MSWRDAPLYVESFDLAAWVLERTACWRGGPSRLLVEATARSAHELVIAASLALTFPSSRGRHLEALDEGIVRLRIELRLAERLGELSPRQLRFAAERLAGIGKMVGGWRKRVERRERRRECPSTPSLERGEGPPPAGV